MEAKSRIAVFLAEFDLQVQQLTDIYGLLEKRLDAFGRQAQSVEMVESTGYWLHNLYCAFEDLFKIIAAFWENHVINDGGFHANLLKRMRVPIEGMRPAVLSAQSYASLDELRGFRHVFRHAYSFGLDDQRVLFLLRRVIEKRDFIIKDLQEFRRKIATLGPVTSAGKKKLVKSSSS